MRSVHLHLRLRCLLCLLLGRACAGVEAACQAAYPARDTELEIHRLYHDGAERLYFLYVPFEEKRPWPVWILCPGTNVDAMRMLSLTDTLSLAKKHSVALVVLEGVDLALNVAADAQEDPSRPDDVGYTNAVLSHAQGRACLDVHNLYCIGSSRGARFCSRLASELPGLRGLLTNAGLRFARPNNASQPLPIVTIHDERDSVNPFRGGGAAYWGESTPAVVQAWSSFNGCKERILMSVEPIDGAWLERHTSCDSFAEVWLLVTNTGRHSWPGNVFTEIAWQVMQRQQLLRNGSEAFEDLGGPDWPPWPLLTGLAHAAHIPLAGLVAGALRMAMSF